MQYLPVERLADGMALGQDIFDGEGRMLLAKHQILNGEYIITLEQMGYPGVYIDSLEYQDIQVEEIIKPEIRSQALKIVHALFVEEEDAEETEEWHIRKVIMNVVNDILSNRDVMYNMMELKNYDDYTFFHSVNVAILSAVIGARFGLDDHELRGLTTAALMHDIGKKFLEIDVLNAKRSLSDEERRTVLQHPKLGYEFLRDYYDFSPEVYTSVLEHHESYNGEGYPLRKSGEDIMLYARMIKLADVYDAMTSKRPYREALSPSDAVEYIMAMNGVEFDPQLVDVFIHWMAVYPVGCEVELSDRSHAVIKENHIGFLLRPTVKLMGDGSTINLKDDKEARSLTIIRQVL